MNRQELGSTVKGRAPCWKKMTGGNGNSATALTRKDSAKAKRCLTIGCSGRPAARPAAEPERYLALTLGRGGYLKDICQSTDS